MHITIQLHARDVPCERCGWQDAQGGVQLVDDQRVSKVFCHECTVYLVRQCLPDGRYGSYEAPPAPTPVALAS
jgi:hypothetical protein